MMKQSSKYLLYLGLVLAICHPFLYFGLYSGDAIIHLIFAKNALNGHLFQFNPGHFSGGETSPGFMFIESALMKMYGEELLPSIIKTLNLLSFYAIGFLTYRLAKLLKLSPPLPLLAGVIVLLLPGNAYNGMIGTENGLFAAGILLLTHELLRRGWLNDPTSLSHSGEMVIGTCLGFLFLLRPETAPFAGVLYGYRLVITFRNRSLFMRALSGGIAAFLAFILIAGSYICWYRTYTGIMPYSAGVARSILSNMDYGFSFFSIPVNLKFLKRLVYYSSLTFPGLLSVILLAGKKIPPESARITGLFLTIFVTFFILYSTVLPAVHLARYTIFLWPFLILPSALALAWIRDNFSYSFASLNLRPIVFCTLGVFFVAAGVTETSYRVKFPSGNKDGYQTILAAPYKRKQIADNLFREFGSPTKVPVKIALQEVQLRYWLDSRFTVHSLDGIIDNSLTNYVHDGYYDYIRYFSEHNIDFFSSVVRNYNKDKTAWSIAELRNTKTGDRMIRDGIEFEKIAHDWVKITTLKK